MMNLTIDRDRLQSLVRAAMPAVASRTTIPALKCFYLKAHDGMLAVSAYDTEIHLSATSPCETPRAGVCLIDAAKLAEIAKLASAGPITIQVDKSILVKAGGSYKLPITDVMTFPSVSLPTEDATEFAVPSEKLKQLFARTAFCCTKRDGEKYATTGVLLDVEGNQLTAVGTDTARMSIAQTRLEVSARTVAAIIPQGTVSAISQAFGMSELVRVQIWRTQARFATETTAIHTVLISGKFAPWRLLIEKTKPKGTLLRDHPADLAQAFRRASVTADTLDTTLCVRATGPVLSLSMQAQAGDGEVEHTCSAHDGADSDIETLLFPGHISEYLSIAQSQGLDEVLFALEDNKKPAWFDSGDGWQYMTMPKCK